MPPDAGSYNKTGQLPKEESRRKHRKREIFVQASSQRLTIVWREERV